MEFTYQGTEYRVVFSHPTENVGNEYGMCRSSQPKRIRHTIVNIYTGPRGELENTVATAKVTYYNPDNFSHEKGRKRALRVALRNAPISRSFRTAFWKAYHSRQGGMNEPASLNQTLKDTLNSAKKAQELNVYQNENFTQILNDVVTVLKELTLTTDIHQFSAKNASN